jgi:hypothetical protein
MIIPFFLFVSRYWGRTTALIACVVLNFVPMWWTVGLYGHPKIFAILFLFIGLVLIGYRNDHVGFGYNYKSFFVFDAMTIIAFSLSLVFKLDVVLMFPLITATLVLEKIPLRTAFLRSIIYGAAALFIFFFVKSLVLSSSSNGFLLTMVHKWHSPSRYIQNFGRAFAVLLLACHPLFFVLFSTCFVFLLIRRDYRTIFFLLPAAVVNLVFWIPNPMPGRHFLPFAPLVALSIGLLLSTILKSSTLRERYFFRTPYFGVAILILISLISSEYYNGIVRARHSWKFGPQNFSSRVPIRSTFINKYYTEKYYHQASRLAQDLIKLPKKNKPIIVIADPYPILLWLKIFSKDSLMPHTQIDDLRAYIIENKRNKFIIVSTYKRCAQKLLKEYDSYRGSYLIVDTYNPLIIFNIEPFKKNYVFMLHNNHEVAM